MLKIGLTGNIGSGKSICAKIFSLLGVPVYNADIEAKKLYANPSIRDKVIDAFGNDILTANDIDKIKLAQIVFNDKAALTALNNIIHPEVRNNFNRWVNEQEADLTYVIQEAAIIFESGFEQYFDKIIVVNAPIEARIERIMKRDASNKQEILNRMNNQMSDDIKASKADYIIQNIDTRLIIPQVIDIHTAIINLV